MKNGTRRYAAVLLLLAVAACNDFLTGDKLSSDPNQPQTANRYLLLNGVQAQQFTNLTGAAARAFGIFTQQFAGTDRQYGLLEVYAFTGDDYTSTFNGTYASGGLVDIRKIEDDARAAGDRIFLGVAQVWEAIDMGNAATLWGDIPYREAANASIANPHFDPEAQVYGDVQQLLDSAIANLTTNQGLGPQAYDLIYGASGSSTASVQKWVAAAHTLKARYYMHLAEKDPSNYAKAIAQANLGIMDPKNDFTTYQSTTPGEENLWWQFSVRDRDTYIRANATLVDLMKSRNDPRLPNYFAPNAKDSIVGSPPGGKEQSASTLSALRASPDFRQPLITAAENLLIRAEAKYQTGDATAINDLNTVRGFYGLPAIVATGPALLRAIAEEEYVALFQNIEVMALYSRTCYPNITPTDGGSNVPRRLYYGTDERNANPNTPASENLFNSTDKAGGTVNAAGSCLGQAAGG
ncbi:MAG: SusD/RagB family nutrient-binding outer membrane lipoprotein [Gemmatimonadaceae bacterium]|nr:SusD/RagB family nutrient-binding outer membrane lipoprotein [Gemmatimonadaceae bacterium]NUQ94020.1 SusD/RagB family nutrient-binding outer membrane lipoprotein [Gemmatimonadaceae bacterium]NUR18713.1 SusD/RagB family nutrient-binding outer membrane lipoprotein [Gemmatimonadaceae bacterium]NUS96136.1 SusD/RagB family nutrient-binding outer membrane lipoprotein [Gemmatimonadaceae bacterium]